MKNLWDDVRFAVRMLRKNPAFLTVAVTILALGIGANTAIFSVVNAVLLRPLPYENPERLVLIWETLPDLQLDFLPLDEHNYLEWKEQEGPFSAVSAFRIQNRTLTGESDPETIVTAACDADLPATLGVTPLLGQGFPPGSDQPGSAPVILISHALWQSRYGADPGMVGRSIRLDGLPHTVVGVLPVGFEFPPPLNLLGSLYELNASVFVPYHFDRAGSPERNVIAVGRLKDGLSLAAARTRARSVVARIIEAQPGRNPDQLGALLAPLHGQAVGRAGDALAVLLGAVTLILLIACVNVANLLLVRASGRRHEIAVRMALGAGRGQVIRQLLVESGLLGLLGGALGMLLAGWSLGFLEKISTGHIPRMSPITIDLSVLGFTLAVAGLTSIVFGLAPALQISRPDLTGALKEEGRGGGAGVGRRRFREALLVAEVALAVTLLVGAGLLLKSLWRIQEVDAGFHAGRTTVVKIQLPGARYPDDGQVQDFYRLLVDDLQSNPRIQSAGAVSGLPLSGDRYGGLLEIEGRPTPTQDQKLGHFAGLRISTPGYFQAMGIPIVRGRAFQSADRGQGRPVAVIDRALADRFWPGGNPIGSRLTFQDDADPDVIWREIVGIVGDVRQESLDKRVQMQGTAYFPHQQYSFREMSVVVRSGLPARAFSALLRETLSRFDGELPLRTTTLDALVRAAQSERRSPAVLVGIFAALALALSVVGLYGVTSYLAGQRTGEIGVRMALGAARRDILKMVGLETALLISVGIVLGLGGAAALAVGFSDQLYAVSPTDPSTYLAVSALFALVAGFSGYLPARRASRVDPIVALHYE